MGLIKNLKKTISELEEGGVNVEVATPKDPEEYNILERGSLEIAGLVAPESATIAEDYYKVGDEYTRTLFIHTYPTQDDDNSHRNLHRYQPAIEVAIYIKPIPPARSAPQGSPRGHSGPDRVDRAGSNQALPADGRDDGPGQEP